MDQYIKQDLYRYVSKPYSFRNLLRGFRSQGFIYLYFKRVKDHNGAKSFFGILSSLMIWFFTYRYGFQIGGKIGPGFYIGHFGTIIVSADAVIGKNCNISPGVTIGRDHRGKRRGAPKIGDYVWIGTNAVIVGNVEIGNDILIAPNTFVNFDVPDHSIVVGNPARIIPRENATEGYINNTLDD